MENVKEQGATRDAKKVNEPIKEAFEKMHSMAKDMVDTMVNFCLGFREP